MLRYDIDIYKNIDIRYIAFDMPTTNVREFLDKLVDTRFDLKSCTIMFEILIFKNNTFNF